MEKNCSDNGYGSIAALLVLVNIIMIRAAFLDKTVSLKLLWLTLPFLILIIYKSNRYYETERRHNSGKERRL